jgi:hypothetical protein
LNNSDVLLTWETVTEVNNFGFNVERYSNSTWETLNFILGANLSNSPLFYSYLDTSVIMGSSYLYRLKQIDIVGSFKYSDTLHVSVISGVNGSEKPIARNYSVSQNYPNPFNPSTNINYELGADCHVSLKVFDILGKELVTLIDEFQNAGLHHYQFSITKNMTASGVYLFKLSAGNISFTRKMVLSK